ncbi:MAG: allantoinase AllB [Acidobacteriota bacterium]|nr:allantoinase AllB [Acidobacteriota bacterium]
MHDLVIRGGDIEVAIEGEYIAEVGSDLPAGPTEMDATGLTIFPGLVDVHVHFNEPGRADWEGAETGSRAFAAGGGTTFIDMPLNSTPCTLNGAEFDRKAAALNASSITDFALWGGLVPGSAGEMDKLAERGVVGFKAFMCNSGLPEFPRSDDLTLFEGMRTAARLGLPVAVHAENEEITAGLTRRLIEEGRNDIAAFLESRPVVAEVEAIRRAGFFARQTGCRLHVVHISSGSGIAAALEARALGADVSIETCPHYLFFTEDDLYRIGALAKCAPPLRSREERDSLWQAVLASEVDIVGSDHSPCPPAMKERSSFFEIWGGIAGIQTTLPSLIHLGLSPERIAKVTATNGARRFGLAMKGAIQPGLHADLALVDVNAVCDIREETLLHRHRASPYVGAKLRGVVRKTLRRGELIYSDGVVMAGSRGRLIRPSKGK